MRSSSQSGVTLVEIMVVVAIVAIIAAVSVPNLTDMLPRIRVNQAARVISGDLVLSRTSAIKDNCPYEVVFDLSLNNAYYVIRDPQSKFDINTFNPTTFSGTPLTDSSTGLVMVKGNPQPGISDTILPTGIFFGPPGGFNAYGGTFTAPYGYIPNTSNCTFNKSGSGAYCFVTFFPAPRISGGSTGWADQDGSVSIIPAVDLAKGNFNRVRAVAVIQITGGVKLF